MLARLTVDVGEPRSVLAVPRSAVLWQGTQPYLFVRRDDGAFERHAVDVGRDDDRWIEIRTGVREGESVAVAGIFGLQDAYATVK
jgi:membrane fusion protein, heavy metal efflux system